jgi:hypothetical protein
VDFQLPSRDEPQHQSKIVGNLRVAHGANYIIDGLHFTVLQFIHKHVKNILKNHSFIFCLQKHLFSILHFLNYMVLQSLIISNENILQNTESECSIETRTVSSGFAIEPLFLEHVLYFDIKTFVIGELVQHHENLPFFSN